ncbi:MAG: DoxX family protein [Candidatus Krumholzibacteria bacterium]|nr:DoxX family protein [Candidatus Krumholzibacteria bacterium]MDH4338052.1 DoxX family protein [Candidatus Krumholzibacteria bacterium]MDH5269403.1 DoxX family protein [Candidatus Krumholzibacteria bacterium]MDH5627326.1 DoxX family protein [Candidatus Krumholzibacteria bacterium]
MFGKMTSAAPVSMDFGLLLLRVGIGASMFLFHGYDKIMGGPEKWEAVGGSISVLGISFAPVFWGFMAAFSESVCSLLLILGPLFRMAALLLGCTMFVAVLRHLNLPADNPASGWSGASHALELLTVYIALFFTGPGRFAFKLGRVK